LKDAAVKATKDSAAERLREALTAELARSAGCGDSDPPPTRLDAIVRTLVDRAATGDVAAIREVFDRTAGWPGQALKVEAGLAKDFPLVQLSWSQPKE
jgi:hypothetical protein